MEIYVDKDWWQITEFSVEVSRVMKEKFDDDTFSVHYNTVDKWFKALEDEGIHYVTRKNGEKVYTTMDLHIACFIAEARRDGNYRLGVIYKNVPRNLEVREFPEDSFRGRAMFIDEEGQPITREQMKAVMKDEIMSEVGEALIEKLSNIEMEMNKKMADQLQEAVKKMLPPPVSKEEERAKRMDDTITRMRIEMQLEEMAIKEWEMLPEGERTKKAGIFRREEDLLKRDKFIRAYKKDNLNKVLEEAYTID